MINLIISDASARRSKCPSLIFTAKPIFNILFIDFCDESHQQGSTHRSVRVGAKLFWHERTNSHRVVRGSLVSRTKNICSRYWLKFKLFFMELDVSNDGLKFDFGQEVTRSEQFWTWLSKSNIFKIYNCIGDRKHHKCWSV